MQALLGLVGQRRGRAASRGRKERLQPLRLLALLLLDADEAGVASGAEGEGPVLEAVGGHGRRETGARRDDDLGPPPAQRPGDGRQRQIVGGVVGADDERDHARLATAP